MCVIYWFQRLQKWHLGLFSPSIGSGHAHPIPLFNRCKWTSFALMGCVLTKSDTGVLLEELHTMLPLSVEIVGKLRTLKRWCSAVRQVDKGNIGNRRAMSFRVRISACGGKGVDSEVGGSLFYWPELFRVDASTIVWGAPWCGSHR